jgi:NhaP-type Na+/H+ or K+/H+ antiporter
MEKKVIIKIAIGAACGAVLGFLYYRFVGCHGG